MKISYLDLAFGIFETLRKCLQIVELESCYLCYDYFHPLM